MYNNVQISSVRHFKRLIHVYMVVKTIFALIACAYEDITIPVDHQAFLHGF